MDDIPLADVVTAQPGRSVDRNPDRDESGTDRSTSDDPVLSGTGPLKSAESLVVKQRIRAFEILSLCTLCEVNNPMTRSIHKSRHF